MECERVARGELGRGSDRDALRGRHRRCGAAANEAEREAHDFYSTFKDQLTQAEWEVVRAGGPTLDDQYEAFSRFWSAKEAFVKARGDGIAFELGKVEFRWVPLPGFPSGTAYEATCAVEGRPAELWRFIHHRLPGEKAHWVTVARGPLTDIIDAMGEFTRTLRRPQSTFDREASYSSTVTGNQTRCAQRWTTTL